MRQRTHLNPASKCLRSSRRITGLLINIHACLTVVARNGGPAWKLRAAALTPASLVRSAPIASWLETAPRLNSVAARSKAADDRSLQGAGQGQGQGQAALGRVRLRMQMQDSRHRMVQLISCWQQRPVDRATRAATQIVASAADAYKLRLVPANADLYADTSRQLLRYLNTHSKCR